MINSKVKRFRHVAADSDLDVLQIRERDLVENLLPWVNYYTLDYAVNRKFSYLLFFTHLTATLIPFNVFFHHHHLFNIYKYRDIYIIFLLISSSLLINRMKLNSVLVVYSDRI